MSDGFIWELACFKQFELLMLKNKLINLLIASFLFVAPAIASADTIVLLHGYLGSPQEWKRADIVQQLDEVNWRDAGVLNIKGDRVFASKENQQSTRRVYRIQLESEQSIDFQAKQLDQYLEYIRHAHAHEQIILLGHSAGGIVARNYMVQTQSEDVTALITIASPHLGTNNAQLAQSISENVLSWVYGVPGVEKLYRSQGLFFDLIPNRSDNLLAWLNVQEHPQARYFSIVRQETDDAVQDFIVPSWSQDMNEVYALRGRSETHTLKAFHALSKKDAQVIKSILIDLYTI